MEILACHSIHMNIIQQQAFVGLNKLRVLNLSGCTNLDSKSTTDLLDLMYKLNQEENMTFVFATHDQRVIDRAKRVIYIDDGKIIKDEVR